MARLLHFCLIVSTYDLVSAGRILQTFSPSPPAVLQNFVLDSTTNDLYVGAVNYILKLNEDLQKTGSITTGPKNDNYRCRPDPNSPCCGGSVSCSATREPTDAVNKLLVLHEGSRTLVSCSTLYYGSCEKVSLSNFQTVGYIYRSVVNNDPGLPDVGFIGEGLSSDGALYVASTRSLLGESTYRNKLPLLATRNVQTLELSHPRSSISLVDRKPVFFKYGFEKDGYNYFLAVHGYGSANRNRTYIVRVCQNDMNYRSYMEIPIECARGITIYNNVISATISQYGRDVAGSLGPRTGGDVLYGTFVNDRDGKSAICSYSVSVIRQQFEHTLQSCFNGDTNVAHIGPSHLATNQACVRRSYDVSNNYCGLYGDNTPIEGKTIMQAETTIPLSETHVTAIKIKIVDEHTIAYIGTQSGQLLKVLLETGTSGVVYDSFDVGAGSILPKGLVFDSSLMNLYVLTPSKVVKVQVSECEQHDSCTACIDARDPHCGWCFSKNKCSYQDECPDTNHFSWLPSKDTCPAITRVEPQQIPSDSFHTRAINVQVDKFARLADDHLMCVLTKVGAGSPEESVSARVLRNLPTGTRIACDNFAALPPVPEDKDHVEYNLDLMVAGSVWSNTTLTVFDCSRQTSCIACAGSSMPCNWCVRRHTCVSERDGCPGDDVSVVPTTSNIRNRQNTLVGKERCPQWSLLPTVRELVAPASISRRFKVRAFNLQRFHRDITCRFSTPAQTIVSQARVENATFGRNVYEITCDNRVLTYVAPKPFEMVPFDIMWDNYPIDNTNRVQIKVYKCGQMENTCGKCLLLREDFECGWCENGCTLQSDCPSTWLDRDATCGNPSITSFTPVGGPVNGKTNITVTGVNLGKIPEDLSGHVFLGTVPCTIVPDLYIPASGFTCTAGPSPRAGEVTLRVTVANRYNTSSRTPYTFSDPDVTSFSPLRGPVSGGTVVTVTGRNLHLGNKLTVQFNGIDAEIVERESTKLVLKTPSQQFASPVRVTMHVDNVVDNIFKDNFRYESDPVVTSVNPVSSIFSGGNELTVTGRKLDVVQTPKIVAIIGYNFRSTAVCRTVTSSKMLCPSPDIKGYVNRPSPIPAGAPVALSQQIVADFSFIMDNADGVFNASQEGISLHYFPDPKVYQFSGTDSTKKYISKEPLQITGEQMDVIKSFMSSISVTVGGSPCPVDTVTPVSLTCTPPSKPRNMTQSKALVKLVLGNYKVDVGYLVYAKTAKISTGGIVAIALVIVLLIILAIVIAILIKRKRHREAVKKLKMMPRPDSIPNAYYERGQQHRSDLDGATAGRPEEVPLKSAEDGGEHVELSNGLGEKSNWKDLLSRIENPKIRESVREVMISRDRLETGELVGKGHFSCVYSGTLRDLALENPEKVAVKTLLNSDFDSHSVENFLKEGVIMKNFNHPHVLRLLGVVVGEDDVPMVVLPFMDQGDLRSYVKDKKKNFTARQLLSLAQQVAEGMAYLASLNCVHRDLAARNCMIDNNNVVRVADFGLTRDLYERDYYSTKDRKAKLPIKWMALESLEDFVFTTRTDVWSYGVLMWELMTRGVTPYPDVDVFDIRNYLHSGRRLRKPKYCPDNVYKIMLDCWNEYPERRPTFADLVNKLEMLLNPPKKRLPEPEPEPMYQNINKSDSAEYLNPVSPTSEDPPVSPPPVPTDSPC